MKSYYSRDMALFLKTFPRVSPIAIIQSERLFIKSQGFVKSNTKHMMVFSILSFLNAISIRYL